MTKLDRTFTATLHESARKGGWTYVVRPGSVEQAGDTVTVRPDERIAR